MTEIKTNGRRHDLDALRVFCFGTLIIYHTSLIYGTRSWHLNSSESNRLIDLIGVASHPWRMSLLFFISGLVTRSLLRNRSVREIRDARTRQLLLPFLLGVILIVPPQIYLSRSNPFPDLSYWEFWRAYMVSSLTLEHVWFLAYLWIYMFTLSFAWPFLERLWPNVSTSLAATLRGKKLFLVPILFLSVLRLCLFPLFGETLVITTDFYAHSLYFSMFTAGFLLMNEPLFWQEVDRQRWLSLSLALISFFVVATIVVAVPRESLPNSVIVILRIVRTIFQWCAILTLLAFAGRIANRPSRVIAFLNKSMMTYYVAHQTVIVFAAYYISKIGLLDVRSFLPIVLITAAACVLIAEIQKLIETYLLPLIAKTSVLVRTSPKASASGPVID
jgi:hypothetical protein